MGGTVADMKRLAAAFAASVVFATLCTLNLWQDAQRLQSPFVDYYRGAPRHGNLAAGTALAMLILAVLFFGIQQAAEHLIPERLRRTVRGAFIAAFLYPAYLLLYVVSYSDLGAVAELVLKCLLFALMAAVVLLAASYLIFARDWPWRVACGVNRALFPLPLILAGATLLNQGASPESFRPAHPALATAGQRDGPRVLWVIFDEFGYTPAFAHRPESLALPELDRLRGESLFATNAYSPADDTLTSLPSLIDGEPYAEVRIAGVSQLLLRRAGERAGRPWTARRSLFWDLDRLGRAGALAGWDHPYCRVLNSVLADCVSVAAANSVLLIRESHARRIGIWRTALYLLRAQAGSLPLIPRENPDIVELGRAEQTSELVREHPAALRMALSPEFSVVLVHYPVPHPYGIYNRASGTVGVWKDSTYFDNLALSDRLVGELRAGLERKGLWERTSLIVSSDHPLRPMWDSTLIGADLPADRRVPVLVKLAGQTKAVEYGRRMNTVVTKALILAIEQGQVSTVEQLQSWLAAR